MFAMQSFLLNVSLSLYRTVHFALLLKSNSSVSFLFQ